MRYTTPWGEQQLVYNNNAGRTTITGTLRAFSGTAYADSVFDHRMVWEGENDYIRVTHDMHFNNDDAFVIFTTKITALQDISDVLFARIIDPDVDYGRYNEFATNNRLGASDVGIPASDIAIAEGPFSGRKLVLYSSDRATSVGVYDVRAGITAEWSFDPERYLGGANDGNGDYAIGMGWRVSSSMSADSDNTVQYVYAQSEYSLPGLETATSPTQVSSGLPCISPMPMAPAVAR